MKYIIRLNSRAVHPLTRRVSVKLLWEVEQSEKIGGNGRIDSPVVIWHCENVRIDGKPIDSLIPLEALRDFGKSPVIGEKRWALEVWGICSRGSDDAIEIRTTPKAASGN